MSDTLIREYYACFNERRYPDIIPLFTEDAILEHILFGERHRGSNGYIRCVREWEAAFPDAKFDIEHIDHRNDTMFDVHLVSTGTHRGILNFGVFQFKPTGIQTTLRMRELLTIRDGRIASSSFSFDLFDLISQLSVVDYVELSERLECIRRLSNELKDTGEDPVRRRAITDRLGPELDAARRALRPHYNR